MSCHWHSRYSMYDDGILHNFILNRFEIIKYVLLDNNDSEMNQTNMTDNKKLVISFLNFLGVFLFLNEKKIIIVSKYLQLVVILFQDLIEVKFMHIFIKIISTFFKQLLNKIRVTPQRVQCKIQWAINLIIINIFKKPLVAYSFWRVQRDIMIKNIGLFIYYVQNLVIIH